jgi:hypothetical protein
MNDLINVCLQPYKLNPNLQNLIKKYIFEYLSVCKNHNNLLNFYTNPQRKTMWNYLSFQSNFVFNKIMCDLMNKLYGKYEFNYNISIIYFIDTIDITIESLKENGYYIGKIDNYICENIINKLKSFNFKERKTNKIVKYGLPKEAYTSNSAWCISQDDIINLPEVQKIISDEKLLHIIQEYLGVKPILTQTNLWFTHNVNNEFSTNAQLYHRDFDHERWLKVFIYLNDVTKLNGPHCFVKKSHLDIGTIGRGAFERENDKTIEQHYPKENIIMHTGKQGTLIIEDTRGYHKGLPVISGERIILQIEYAINPSYGKQIPPFKINNKENILEYINKYKYVYQNVI